MDEFPIHAYLSYRMLDRDRNARDKLKAICDAQGITLVYAESETEQGDCLIKFMDDLTSARFVFLFLSPEYFRSSYTLYELIKIHEWAEIDQRFILPIRLTDNMDGYQLAKAESYFNSNVEIRDLLDRLLKFKNPRDSIGGWDSINKALEKIVTPELLTLNYSLEHEDADRLLHEHVEKVQKNIKSIISASQDELKKFIVKNITSILGRKSIDLDKLADELELNRGAQEFTIAEKLVSTTPNSKAIVTLTHVLTDQKKILGDKSNQWLQCFTNGEQLLGWLLINTVNPVWWFHNEIRLNQSASKSISSTFSLDDPAYVEVIMARWSVRPAEYSLNQKGKAKAGKKQDSDGIDATLIFDGISKGALDEELLIGIYKDLYGNPPDWPSDWNELLLGIETRAETHFEDRRCKFVYYLVTDEYLALLEERVWFSDFQLRLAPYLKFICCERTTKSSQSPASIEKQTKLLDKVAFFLLMNK